MNGEIYQSISLVIHGNAFKQGFEINNFPRSSSAFQHCDSVRFKKTSRKFLKKNEVLVSDGVLEWYRAIIANSRGTRLLIPSNAKNYSMVGLAGGGSSLLIEVVGDNSSTLWQPVWRFQSTKEKWNVDYIQIAEEVFTLPPVELKVAQTTELLESALHRILNFTNAHDLGFQNCFEAALEALDSSKTDFDLNLTPQQYIDIDAAKLLNSVAKGWVFGAMGSWNDTFPPEGSQEEYNEVSGGLYSAILLAVRDAANSTFTRQ